MKLVSKMCYLLLAPKQMICWSAIHKNLACKLIIGGQQNVLRSLLRKWNDEVLTTSYTYKYLRLKQFLILELLILTIPPVKKYATPWKCNIFLKLFFQENNI